MNTATRSRQTIRRSGATSRGLSLIFSLLALVAMTLGAVALVRSVDTGVLALGNMAFRQAGVASATRSTEDAIAWLSKNINEVALEDDLAASGYYASSIENLDASGRAAGSAVVSSRVDWDGNGCKVDGVDEPHDACLTASALKTYGTDEVRYVITRLCPSAGKASTLACAQPPIPGKALVSDRGGSGVGPGSDRSAAKADLSPYFRILVRARGPRGTVSFTETLVHF